MDNDGCFEAKQEYDSKFIFQQKFQHKIDEKLAILIGRYILV